MSTEKRSLNVMLRTVTFAVLAAGAAPNLLSADDLSELGRLVEAEGEKYKQLRDTLVERRTGHWDVASASNGSWELGLAAYIVNARTSQPEFFRVMDKERPRHTVRLSGYTRGPSNGPWIAFLLEKMWKAPSPSDDKDWTVTPDEDRQYAFNTLGQAQLYKGAVWHPALWRSIWKQCADERFRYLAISRLCADPGALDIIDTVLRDTSENGKQFKYRCLSALVFLDSEEAKKIVIDEWPRLNADGLTERTIGVLATSTNPRARELMYAVALDPHQPKLMRRNTIAKLSHDRPGDRAFIRKFLAMVESPELKRDVVAHLAKWFPLEWYREPVREMVRTSSDPRMLRAAVSALLGGHKAPLPMRNVDTGEWEFNRRSTPVDALDVEAWQEDVALLEELATRDNLTDDLKMQIERGLIGMREARRQFDRK